MIGWIKLDLSKLIPTHSFFDILIISRIQAIIITYFWSVKNKYGRGYLLFFINLEEDGKSETKSTIISGDVKEVDKRKISRVSGITDENIFKRRKIDIYDHFYKCKYLILTYYKARNKLDFFFSLFHNDYSEMHKMLDSIQNNDFNEIYKRILDNETYMNFKCDKAIIKNIYNDISKEESQGTDILLNEFVSLFKSFGNIDDFKSKVDNLIPS